MDVFDLYAKISLDTSGYESGLKDASNKTKGFGSKLASGIGSAAKLATTAMAAIGTATVAATGAFIAGAKDVAVYGDNIDKMSQKMGMSAEAYQEWDAVMQHSGTSMETMKASMKTLANAVESGNDAFKRIGLTQEELASMSQEDIFAATIAGLQNVEDTTERTYLAGQLLGRGATELGALLNTSAEETQAMRDRVHELGGVMSDEAVKASAAFQDNLQDLQTAIGGIKRGITSELLPGLNLLMEGFTSLIVGEEGGVESFNEGFNSIIDTVGGATEKVFDILGQIAPTIFETLMANLPKAFDFGMELVGNIVSGITDHTDDIIGAASSIIDVFSENIGDWIEVGGNLIGDVVDGITQAIPQLLTSVGGAVQKIVQKVTDPKVMGDLLKSGLNMIKTLVKGIIQGAPAVIKEIPTIIRNLLTIIREGLPELINTVVELVNELVSALPEIITSLLEALPEIITMVIDTLVEALPVLINGVVQIVTAVAEHLPEIIQAIIDALPGIIQSVIDALMTLIPAIVQGLVQLVVAIVPHIPEIIMALIQAIPQVIEAILTGFLPFSDKIIAFFKGVFDNVGTKVSEIVDKIKEFFEPLYDFFEPLLTGISDLFSSIWETIKTNTVDRITELKEKIDAKFSLIKSVISLAMDFIKTIVSTVWIKIKNNTIKPLADFGELIWKKFEDIKDWAKELIDGALSWGKDMIDNFISGIKSGVGKLGAAMSELAGSIKAPVHFSEPDVGPLKDFHTYAPDMIDLFTQGINDNKKYLQDTVADAFDFKDLIEAPETAIVSADGTMTQRTDSLEGLMTQMLSVMREIADKDITLEGDARELFRVVERENRARTKATGYNSLAMAGGV